MDREQIAALLLTGVLTAPVWMIGIVLCCGHGAGLIAGYNTASVKERERWNEKALCRGAGVLVLAILACLELSLAGAVLGSMPLLWTGLALTALAAAGGVIYLNTSRRFKKT